MKRGHRSTGAILLPAAIAAALASAPALAADPTTADCLSANDASISLRNQHKLRAARAQLLVCAAATCPADIRTECTRRVTDINAAMPTIVFEAKDPAGNDLSAVKVTLDGQVITDRLEGTALSIDPGEHSFTFESAGQPTVQKSFVIREAEKDRRERIQLGTPTGPVAPTGDAKGVAPVGATGEPHKSVDSSKLATGVVVGVVGVGGVGVGVTLLVLASSLSSRSKTEDTATPGSGHSDYQAAVGDQTAGFVAGGVGIVALGVGTFLLVTSFNHSSGGSDAPATASLRLAPEVGPGRAGLGLVGTF